MTQRLRCACRAAACLLMFAQVSGAADAVDYPPVVPGYGIEFPRDEGSHPRFRTEWWYLTGWLRDEAGAARGFQITFFRTRLGIGEQNPSRFAPRQLLFAHAAISDPQRGRLLHAERSARAGFGLAQAAEGSLDVKIGEWQLQRAAAGPMHAVIPAGEFTMDFVLTQTQPPLLQGEEGFSQKGPQRSSASYYYSLPHLQVAGRLRMAGREHEIRGLAWMDHEWSSEIMDEEAAGWDWVGLNLNDGGAVMASRMRDAHGGSHWAAATWRREPAGQERVFQPAEVHWTPLRRWRSPRTGVEYPVEWRVRIGDRAITLRPLMDDQENDATDSTGTLYWEGAVRAYDEAGREIGRGYLEMTGYAEKVTF